MDDFFLFAGIIAVPVAIVLLRFFFFSPRGKIRWALRSATVVPVARVKDGQLAKVVGRLRFTEQPLIAPLSGRRCACWQVTVKRQRSLKDSEAEVKDRDDDLSGWVAIVDDRAYHSTFWIEDETGRALVEVEAPKLLLTRDKRFQSGALNKATPRLERLLQAYGETSEGRIFSKRLCYYEGALEQGEQVAVFGLCRWEPDPDPCAEGRAYRDSPSRLRITSPGGTELLISDEPFALR